MGLLDPLYRALFRLGRRGRTHAGPAGADMAAGAMVTQKDAEPTRAHLWIGVFVHGHPRDSLAVRLSVERGGVDVHTATVDLAWFVIERERAISEWDAGSRFFHRHVTVDGLTAGSDYEARVEVLDADIPGPARCRVRTLPVGLAVGEELTLVTASCYDAVTDRDDALDRAYRRATAELGEPDLSVLTGDQVYADTPWWNYAGMARATPRTYALMRYWASWGMQLPADGSEDAPARVGLRSILTAGPSWFLGDDHEFWNNWPHASFTAAQSVFNQARGLRGAVRRGASAALALVREPHVVPPDDPGEVPSTGDQGNFLPVHPDEWGRWSRSAFDLFGSFQTRTVRDREHGVITRGELGDDLRDDPRRPPREGTRGVVHRPLTPPAQIVDLGAVQAVLLDTRMRRTRSRTHREHSRFVDETALEAVLAVAARAEVLVLAMPEPGLRAPEPWRPKPPLVADYGIRHYTWQYQRFWAGLVAARRGRPTVILSGDIHRSWIGHAPSLGVIEIVASPMSLVYGQGLTGRLRAESTDPWAPGVRRDLRARELVDGPLGRAEELPAPYGPLPGRDGPVETLVSLPRHPTHVNGFATLSLARRAEHEYALTARLHPVHDDGQGVRTVDAVLRTDGTGPATRAVARPPSARSSAGVPGGA